MSLCSSLFDTGVSYYLLHEVISPSSRTLSNKLITHFIPYLLLLKFRKVKPICVINSFQVVNCLYLIRYCLFI